jgi:hypothetical protein
LLDNFDDRYLGAKASDPALDNDGNALLLGALYFNTTDGVMKVYTASGWIAASSASVATLATFEFVATAGQTVFSGNDANGSSLSYVAPAIIVTLNGVRLRPGDDYTASNGTSITLVSAAALNDELVVDAFGSFLVANTYTIAQTDAGFVAKTSSTGAANLPSGTTAERPGSPVNGQIRYNTTNIEAEAYINGAWQGLGTQTAGTYLVDYLVIAGGGGGGGASWSGGGGAGGYLSSALSLSTSTAYTITIGAGGAGGAITNRGVNGSNSVFGSITAIGGGYGSPGDSNSTWMNAGSGGSGGGGGSDGGSSTGAGGSGTTGQGNAGGTGGTDGVSTRGGGGGGGAGGVGGNRIAGVGGNGGAGTASSITGTSVTRGGGGAGAGNTTNGTATGGGGSAPSGAGTANTGGGGGGASNSSGGAGGSGIVVVRYPGSQRGTGGTVTSSGGYTIHTFTSSGTFTA